MKRSTILVAGILACMFVPTNGLAIEKAKGKPMTMEDQDLQTAWRLAWQRWEKKPDSNQDMSEWTPVVKSVKRKDSKVEKNMYGEAYKIYEVVLTNPVSRIAGPAVLNYCLVMKNQEVYYLETDDEVQAFLSREGLATVTDLAGARRFVRRIAELRHYQVAENPPAQSKPAGKADKDRFGKKDWPVLFEKKSKGNVVWATLLVDQEIEAYVRYRYVIAPDGTITREAVKRMASAGYS